MTRRSRCAGWALALSLLSLPLQAGQYVTILHFNDFHGHLLPDAPGKDGVSHGGLARMATMVAQTRQWNEAHNVPTLLLEAGDILQGTPLSATFKGEPDFTCLNLMGVDAMTLGNHEFDFGLDNLLARVRQARFPVRSASVLRAATRELLTPDPVTYLDLNGVKTAIVPLTTPETMVESAAKNVAGLEFTDPVATVRKLLPAVLQRADFVVALTHLGLEADRRLAREVPQLDVIVGGHSHDALAEPERVGRTLICQAGSYGQYLGQLDAYVEAGEIAKYRGFLRSVDDPVPPRADVAQVVQHYAGQLEVEMARVVGNTSVPLVGDRDVIRSQETNLGNLVADAMRDYAKADIALTNAGGIRAGIDAGPITVGEVLTVLPFDNELVTVDLTGDQVLQVLRRDAALPAKDGGFLQVSGVRFVARGGEVADVKAGDQALRPEKLYRAVTLDFLLTGGNGYEAFTHGRNPKPLGVMLSRVFTDYLKAHGSVAPRVEGRITLEH